MSVHVCPICSTVGSAVAPSFLIMALTPAVNRPEVVGVMTELPVTVLLSLSLARLLLTQKSLLPFLNSKTGFCMPGFHFGQGVIR
jgi:hypothetical protein